MRRYILLAVVIAALSAADTAAAASYSNPTAIGFGPAHPATPFPSQVTVGGEGPVTDVNVTLVRVGHQRADRIAVLLVSPAGTAVMVMAENCGSGAIEDAFFTLDQQAAAAMPSGAACTEVAYRPEPAAYIVEGSFPSPAPPGPYQTSLAAFNGENPNGTWSLYATHSPVGGSTHGTGDIEVGWTLTLTTGAVDAKLPGSPSGSPTPRVTRRWARRRRSP